MAPSTSNGGTSSLKKMNFACELCKVRKRKCDGVEPRCGRCQRLDQKCEYLNAPPLPYVKRLEAQNLSFKSILEGLKAADPTQRDRLLHELDLSSGGDSPAASSAKGKEKEGNDAETPQRMERARMVHEGGLNPSLHGATSLWYLDSPQDIASPSNNRSPATSRQNGQPTFSDTTDNFEEFLSIMNVSTTMPEFKLGVLQHFLSLHFAWAQPLFCWFYRPAMSRQFDNPSLTYPFYSPFLLSAICAHISRPGLGDFDNILVDSAPEYLRGSNPFAVRARSLVGEEVQKPASIATVQGLMALTLAEATAGRVSQAWAYSGMAFSLLQDMGISTDGDPSRAKDIPSEEESEIRARCFWSSFVFDKVLSLYFGRPPRLPLTRQSPRRIFVDSAGDTELWIPYATPNEANFPPVLSRAMATFSAMCGLSEIINDILIYDHGDVMPHLLSTMEKVQLWRASILPALKVDPDNLQGQFIPGHIINLNSIYFSTIILLHERLGTPSQVNHPCSKLTAAFSIYKLARYSQDLYFDRQAVLLYNYCCYVAAKTLILSLTSKGTLSITEVDTEEAVRAFSWLLERLVGASTTVFALRRPIKAIQSLWQDFQRTLRLQQNGTQEIRNDPTLQEMLADLLGLMPEWEMALAG